MLLGFTPVAAADLLSEMAASETQIQLRAARYVPSPELRWVGGIGAWIRVLKVRRITAALEANLETVGGNAGRPFDAPQANYHVELTARRASRTVDTLVFFNHVSRHDLDRPKEQGVDWNVVGARVAARLNRGSPTSASAEFGVGRVVQTSFVNYQWEVTLRGEAVLLSRAWGLLYFASNLRGVTTRPSPALPGHGFVDLLLEGGVRRRGRAGCLGAFLAFEHRNAVLLQAPGARSRAMVGVRLDPSAACGQ